ELTLDWLNKHKIKFSQDAFNKRMEEQKIRSKITSSMKGDVFAVPELKLDVPNTKFIRNKPNLSSLKILKIIKNNKEEKKIMKGDEAEIILDKTIFYPESGGQAGDSGQIKKGKNIFQVLDTQKSGKIIIHTGKVVEGSFEKSDLVSLTLDLQRRLSIARNHTATHLLQSALRKILGPHVQQQGSLVAQDRLRFDFTHFKNITKDELNRIEEVVNEYIIDNHPLNAKEMPLSEAKRLRALAFFAEKYESKVRVVSIGDFSKEFCGGTHLDSTGQIGLFKILQEGSIASGVRRIEALTGKSAFKAVKEEENIVKEVSSILNTSKEKICQELEKKLAKIKEIEKQLHLQKTDSVKTSAQDLLKTAQLINNINFIEKIFDDLDMAALRNAVDILKQKTDNTIIALASKNSGKAMLVIGITTDLLAKGIDACAIIKNISGIFGGSGGGRKDFAQAGGNNPDNFPLVFEELKKIIANLK
ncbi:MAG: alanine--tRNA ligase-related protein, partial [Candidatus Omnitrophota bacterium]